jgi:hypothetical protein
VLPKLVKEEKTVTQEGISCPKLVINEVNRHERSRVARLNNNSLLSQKIFIFTQKIDNQIPV